MGRVRRLYDHGVRIVMLQGADFLLETFACSLLTDIREAVD